MLLSLFCDVALGVFSSLEIILLMKRELVVLLKMCCGYLCSVSFPHGALGWSVIVSFLGLTRLFFSQIWTQ